MVPEISVCNRKPGIVVVEKFLNNPLEHREFALGLEYEKERGRQRHPSLVGKYLGQAHHPGNPVLGSGSQ